MVAVSLAFFIFDKIMVHP